MIKLKYLLADGNLQIGVVLKLTPVVRRWLFAVYLILYFKTLQIVMCFLSSWLLIVADFPKSHNETIDLIISHDLRYRKPSIGQGRYLREYYFIHSSYDSISYFDSSIFCRMSMTESILTIIK